jgi:hypothetical protein
MVGSRQILYCLFLLILATQIVSCGESNINGAGISFSLDFHNGIAKRTAEGASIDICSEYGIDTINATVFDSANSQVGSGTWACSAHAGHIGGLPSGSGFTLRIDGLSGTTKAWNGSKTGLTLVNNTDTNAGPITVTYQNNSLSQVIITVTATGSAAPGGMFSYGATIALPPGITLQSDGSGVPLTGVLSKGPSLSANSLITGKYVAPTTLPGSLTFGIADQSGFSIGSVATINGTIVSGATPPAASGFTISSVSAYDGTGNAINGIGGSVAVRYQ